jgi:hypothetical protein
MHYIKLSMLPRFSSSFLTFLSFDLFCSSLYLFSMPMQAFHPPGYQPNNKINNRNNNYAVADPSVVPQQSPPTVPVPPSADPTMMTMNMYSKNHNHHLQQNHPHHMTAAHPSMDVVAVAATTMPLPPHIMQWQIQQMQWHKQQLWQQQLQQQHQHHQEYQQQEEVHLPLKKRRILRAIQSLPPPPSDASAAAAGRGPTVTTTKGTAPEDVERSGPSSDMTTAAATDEERMAALALLAAHMSCETGSSRSGVSGRQGRDGTPELLVSTATTAGTTTPAYDMTTAIVVPEAFSEAAAASGASSADVFMTLMTPREQPDHDTDTNELGDDDYLPSLITPDVVSKKRIRRVVDVHPLLEPYSSSSGVTTACFSSSSGDDAERQLQLNGVGTESDEKQHDRLFVALPDSALNLQLRPSWSKAHPSLPTSSSAVRTSALPNPNKKESVIPADVGVSNEDVSFFSGEDMATSVQATAAATAASLVFPAPSSSTKKHEVIMKKKKSKKAKKKTKMKSKDRTHSHREGNTVKGSPPTTINTKKQHVQATTTTTTTRVQHARLEEPLPGGCHGQTSRNGSFCRRGPCYKNSQYCKLHYANWIRTGSPVITTTSTAPNNNNCFADTQSSREVALSSSFSSSSSSTSSPILSGSTEEEENKTMMASDGGVGVSQRNESATSLTQLVCTVIGQHEIGCNDNVRKNEDGCITIPYLPSSLSNKATSAAAGMVKTTKRSNQPQDRRFTGCPGQVQCMATTTRGRPCAYVAVSTGDDSSDGGAVKYCRLHAHHDTNPSPPRRVQKHIELSKQDLSAESGGGGTGIGRPQLGSANVGHTEQKINHLPSSSSSTTAPGDDRGDIHDTLRGLNSLSSDQWYHKKVLIASGPFSNQIGQVERWSNGWVTVHVEPLCANATPPNGGTTNNKKTVVRHNRRSFELLLLPDHHQQQENAKLEN